MFLAWSKSDRDKAIWEYVRTASMCARCHTRREEWSEAAGGSRHAYHAEMDVCPGCEKLEDKEDKLDRSKLGKGVQVRLVRAGR